MRISAPVFTLLLATVSPLIANPIRWTATGKVTSAAASAYPGVAANDNVSLEFSYDSGATLRTINFFPIGNSAFYQWEYIDAIQLKIAVTIGSQRWESELTQAASGAGAISCSSWDGGGQDDVLSINSLSGNGATFPAFPYQGAATDRQIRLEFRDATAPPDFLTGLTLPSDQTDTSQITQATGRILVEAAEIAFTIDPASISIAAAEAASLPITLERTANGIQLKWQGELGVSYSLQESDDLSEWTERSSYFGVDAEIVVPLTPFAEHPQRRFYRVVSSL